MDIPKLKLHKSSGQSYIRWEGKQKYFGKHGLPTTDRAYWRWRESLGAGAFGGFTIGELVNKYEASRKWSRQEKSRFNNIRDALGPIAVLDANAYGPMVYREHRDSVGSVGTRSARHINELMRLMQRCVKWGVSMGMVRVETWTALKTVDPLKPYEIERRPANLDDVYASMPFLSNRSLLIVNLLLKTAARPKEIVSLRKDEIDRNGPKGTWVAHLSSHKNAHRGKRRYIVFNAEAQEILAMAIELSSSGEWVFPSEIKHGDHYTVSGLRQAIGHACETAKVRPWTPYQLRHTKGTSIATDQGIEAAAAALGHSDTSTTLIYTHEPSAEDIKRAS